MLLRPLIHVFPLRIVIFLTLSRCTEARTFGAVECSRSSRHIWRAGTPKNNVSRAATRTGCEARGKVRCLMVRFTRYAAAMAACLMMAGAAQAQQGQSGQAQQAGGQSGQGAMKLDQHFLKQAAVDNLFE